MEKQKIKIYSTSTCPYCHMAKDFFKNKKISFEDIDVGEDEEKAQEMMGISGQMGVPVIVINHNVIIGFDKGKIESLLR